MYRADTIVACATPGGRGAIAIVRCSGAGALAVSERVFLPRSGAPLEPWRMRLGTVVAGDGTTPIDEALGVYFPCPASFTGEDTFEIHCHGSPVVVEQIVASAIAAGARAAEPGEFTRRAVLNGKLDLLQAEAVADLIDARMAAGASAAWRQLQGALSKELAEARAAMLDVLADIEAAVDFTDDELPDPDFARRLDGIGRVSVRLETLLRGFAASRRQRDGVRAVFTGRPNAGKSSLVNRLLGSGRMIVSDEPGTTRDVVEETIDLGGIAFVLTDTAGIRDAEGAAETAAVERARETADAADLRVLVIDSSRASSAREAAVDADTIVVLNKQDLGALVSAADFPGAAAVVETSARTGDGCATLVGALVAEARRRLEAHPVGISRVRHRAALERTLEALGRARSLAGSEDSCELAAMELRTALTELAAISEASDNEDVLDRIFSEFCIGK
jgi:tRNA modification GTPase